LVQIIRLTAELKMLQGCAKLKAQTADGAPGCGMELKT
jgi:hypothetical protein